jgi:hypothetical protein
MRNPVKPKLTLPLATRTDRVPEREDVTAIIEALFEVLESHRADPNEGVLALLTSFIQSASRILDRSSFEDAEQNRESLLAMLDHARRAIDTWSTAGQPSGLVM